MHYLTTLLLIVLSTFSTSTYLRTTEEPTLISRMLQMVITYKGKKGHLYKEPGYLKNGKFHCIRDCHPGLVILNDPVSKKTIIDNQQIDPTSEPTKKPIVKSSLVPQKLSCQNNAGTDFSTKIFPWLLQWEGTTYVNNPSDPGGCTKFGISYTNNRADLNNIGINSGPEIVRLTEEQAKCIYINKYWNPVAGGLQYPMNWVYFNAAVNNGPGNAQKFYSQSNGNYEDFISIQRKFYENIVKNKPSQSIFLKGWMNRLNSLENAIKTL
jgi:hypothetical protein